MASIVTLDLAIAMLAHEKGKGLEKDAESDVWTKPGSSLQHVCLYSMEGIGLMAALTAVQAGEVV